MKRSLMTMAAFLGFSLLGCGGTPGELEGEVTPMSRVSTTDTQGVANDGVSTAGAAACTGYRACTSIANTFCSPEGATTHCCTASGGTGDLICSRGGSTSAARWLYY